MPNDLNKGILYDEKRIPRPVINGKAGKYLHRNIKHHQHKHDWSQYGIDTAHIRKHQLKGKPAAPHHYDKQQGLHPNERKHIVLHRKRTYIFPLGTDKLKHDNQIYIGSFFLPFLYLLSMVLSCVWCWYSTIPLWCASTMRMYTFKLFTYDKAGDCNE